MTRGGRVHDPSSRDSSSHGPSSRDSGARSTAGVVAIAACVWLADCCCLIASFGAVRAAVPWSGVVLAYGVAQVAGSLPFVPGGLGIIEGSLAVILTRSGAGHLQALSAALTYRLISFWLIIVIGWITVAVIAQRQARRLSRLARNPHVQAGHRAGW